MTWECPTCEQTYPDSAVGRPADADAEEKVACVACANGGATIPLDPDDMGIGRVQESGLLYVGRAYADEKVRWVIETQDGDEE